MRVYVRLALLLGVVGVLLLSGGGASAAPGLTRRVSVDSAASQGDGPSEYPAISADGRFVAFHSSATNLVTADANGRNDVFVHDRQAGITQRVSVATSGGEGHGDSLHPTVSGDGRYVAFDSFATDLVTSDTNSALDVFVRDRQAGVTERVSLRSAGGQSDGDSSYSAISGDGRYVAFYSFATNLVSGDTQLCGNPPFTYNCPDIFVRDRQAGVTQMLSVSSGGVQGNAGSWDPAISPDGRYVAFYSEASNLVGSDTNGYQDVFVRDRQAGTTERVSVSSSEAQGTGDSWYPAISADGRYVAFFSFAPNLVTPDTNSASDVFVRDRHAGITVRVSVDSGGDEGNNSSYTPAISADGRYVAFFSHASDLVPSDTNNFCQTDPDPELENCPDVFARDRDTDEDGIFDEAGAVSTTRVSVNSFGGEGNGESLDPAISGDGKQVVFHSFASTLVTGDTNTFCDTDGDTQADDNCQDVFLHDSLGAVGGVAQLPDVSGPSAPNYAFMAGLAAAALALLAAGAWYAGRRFRQG